jgi:hypothetical protein
MRGPDIIVIAIGIVALAVTAFSSPTVTERPRVVISHGAAAALPVSAQR